MTERRPVTLITGASAGIGAALAHVFARNGHDLLLVARREQRLAQLADAITAQGGRRPEVLGADLGETTRQNALPKPWQSLASSRTWWSTMPVSASLALLPR